MQEFCKVTVVHPELTADDRMSVLEDIARIASEIAWEVEEDDDRLLDVDAG